MYLIHISHIQKCEHLRDLKYTIAYIHRICILLPRVWSDSWNIPLMVSDRQNKYGSDRTQKLKMFLKFPTKRIFHHKPFWIFEAYLCCSNLSAYFQGVMKRGWGACDLFQSFLLISANVLCMYYFHRDIWPCLVHASTSEQT